MEKKLFMIRQGVAAAVGATAGSGALPAGVVGSRVVVEGPRGGRSRGGPCAFGDR